MVNNGTVLGVELNYGQQGNWLQGALVEIGNHPAYGDYNLGRVRQAKWLVGIDFHYPEASFGNQWKLSISVQNAQEDPPAVEIFTAYSIQGDFVIEPQDMSTPLYLRFIYGADVINYEIVNEDEWEIADISVTEVPV